MVTEVYIGEIKSKKLITTKMVIGTDIVQM